MNITMTARSHPGSLFCNPGMKRAIRIDVLGCIDIEITVSMQVRTIHRSKKMRRSGVKFHHFHMVHRCGMAAMALGTLWLSGPATAANDYPTTSRVEFALECMQAYGGNHEYIYKCSCLIDEIATKLTHDEYVELSSFSRTKSMSGERGGMFRGTDQTRQAVKKYTDVVAESKKRCFIK
jgi:hypothetical protein